MPAEKLAKTGFHIIYYRDGVGEQQFTAIKRAELAALRQAMQTCGVPFAKVTFIICQKRHHTRIFPANARDGDRNGNVKAGTLLDCTITHPVEFDFFLVAHAAIKGTARPTKYHVIHDEIAWKADDLHKLTNELCYTYARSTTAVSLVNVAYYAHLVGNRVRAYCKGLDSDTASVNSNVRKDSDYSDMLPPLNAA